MRMMLTRRLGVAMAARGIVLAAACAAGGPVGSAYGRDVAVAEKANAAGLSQTVTAAHVSVEVTPSAAAITTKDTLDLTFMFTLDHGWTPDVISLEGALPEGWRVASVGLPERGRIGDKDTYRQTIRVEPFLPQEAEIKPIELKIQKAVSASSSSATPNGKISEVPPLPDPASEPVTLTTKPIKVTVTSVLPSDEKDPTLAEIKPVVAPVEPSMWWAWTIGGVVLAGAAALGIFLLARARRRALERIIRRPAHEIALERLAALESRQLLAPGAGEGRVREFFDESSLVLRQYIEDRFGLRAPERTTEEFLAEARGSSRLATDHVETVRKFLGQCDEVKFAKRVPGEAEAASTIGLIRQFIEQTRAPDATVAVSGPGVVEPIAIVMARQREAA